MTGVRPPSSAPSRVLDGLLIGLVLGLAVLVVVCARRREDVGLDHDPLNLPALRRLGLDDDRRGRTADAEKLLAFVGRRSWRDGPTQAWLVRRRLQQGRFDDAFRSADSILRRDADGATRPILYAMFTAAAAFADTRPALETRLASSPDWRSDVLRDIATQGDVTGAEEVLAALARGPTPPTPAEYAPLVDRLVAAGDYGPALGAWRRIARPRGAGPGTTLEGGSEAVFDQTAFTWSTSSGAGWDSEIGPSPDRPGGAALRVDYDGDSAPRLPARLLVLAPGRYRLAWRESAEPRWRARLSWRLRCAGGAADLAVDTTASWAASPPPIGRDRKLDFIVPTAGCRAQWLRLTATPAERPDPVTTWFEAFRVQGVAGLPAHDHRQMNPDAGRG